MKVTKAQAQANRTRVVETAATLFRERGYDGIGVADLMAAAGLTHGGFYKQFKSKADLIAESAACGLAQSTTRPEGISITAFVQHYLSREHRDARATGCTIAALSGDAARQPEPVRATFATGIENLLTALTPASPTTDNRETRTQHLDILAHALGAIILSRACPDDSALADEILAACRNNIMNSLNTAETENAPTLKP